MPIDGGSKIVLAIYTFINTERYKTWKMKTEDPPMGSTTISPIGAEQYIISIQLMFLLNLITPHGNGAVITDYKNDY